MSVLSFFRGKHQAWAVVLGITLLCLIMNLMHNYPTIDPLNYEYGGEYMHIANALSEGRGYSDPFYQNAGATGWMPPGYTYLLYVVKILTSPDTAPTLAFFLTLVTLKCMALGAIVGLAWSLLRAPALPRYCRLCFFPAWLLMCGWARHKNIVIDMHDSWWLALILALCIHGIIRLSAQKPPLTLFIGLPLAALSSPVIFVAALLIIGLRTSVFFFKARRFFWTRALSPVLPVITASLVLFSGWSLYIHATTGIWAPLKTNGGYELWQSLAQTPDGIPSGSTFLLHPINNPVRRAEYARLGEKAYMEKYSHAALAALKAHPLRYLHDCGNRFINAFVWMRSTSDRLNVPMTMIPSVVHDLSKAQIAIPTSEKSICFLYLNKTIEQRNADLTSLPQPSRSFLMKAWINYDEIKRAQHWAQRYEIKELVVSGWVTLCWAVAFLLSPPPQRRRLALPLLSYLIILTPYCLISHYARYQEALLPLQLYAVTIASAYLIEALMGFKQRVSRTVPASSPAQV